MPIIINNFISFSLLTYISNSLLQFKYSKNKSILIFFISFFIFSSINYNGTSSLKALKLFIIFILYIYFQFKGNFSMKMLVVLFFFSLLLFSEILAIFCLGYFFQFESPLDIFSFEFMIGSIISNTFLILFSFLFIYILKYFKKNYLPKYSYLVLFIPIITIFLLLSVDDYLVIMNNKLSFIRFIIIALSNIIFVITSLTIINYISMKNELEITKQKEFYINSKYNLLSQHYHYNFNFLHDLLHTYNTINKHLQQNDLTSVKQQMNQLTETTFKEFNTIYSNSALLNYLLNNKLYLLQENHINFKTVLESDHFEFLDLETQINLFELLINISIEACLKVPIEDRTIILKSFEKANHFIIQIIYPKDSNTLINLNHLEEIIKDYGHLSTKEIDQSLSLLITFYH